MHATAHIIRPLKAAVGPTATKGRGVFAIADIEPGELIEAAPSIELDADACERIGSTRIDDYYFHHPGNEDGGLLVLGLVSVCNHSERANTVTDYEHDPALGWVVRLSATRRIAAGEEITRRYACGPWFQTQE